MDQPYIPPYQNFMIETVPRALGKYVFHTSGCAHMYKPNKLLIRAQHVFGMNEIANKATGGKGIPCAFCFPTRWFADSYFDENHYFVSSARGWPFAPQEPKPQKDPSPYVGQIVFARADNGRWYPAVYERGPHEIRPVAGTNYGNYRLEVTASTRVHFMNKRAGASASPDPRTGIVNLKYALHYMPTWAFNAETDKYHRCYYYAYKSGDIGRGEAGFVFRFDGDIYKIVEFRDMAVIYD